MGDIALTVDDRKLITEARKLASSHTNQIQMLQEFIQLAKRNGDEQQVAELKKELALIVSTSSTANRDARILRDLERKVRRATLRERKRYVDMLKEEVKRIIKEHHKDWDLLTEYEKRARRGRVANLKVAQEVNDGDANLPIAEVVPLGPVAAAAPAAAPRPSTPPGTPPPAAAPHSRPSPETPPEEVERMRREWARKIQREKLEEKIWREKIKERERERERQRNAAEPGKSDGYIDSQLRRKYRTLDRVIVLFTGDDPPKWYKGTIDLKRRPNHPWYYVVFDDGDERWIEYKNNNMRISYEVEVGLEQKQQQRGRGRRKTKKRRRKSRRKKRTKKRKRKKKKRKTRR